MIGTKLGPYQILEEVGKGGMATVYRARQTSVERDVAIKVIQRSISSEPAAVQRFQREAKLIARLEHPHIVPVYDFDGAHEPPYIVMRFMDSGTLKEVMEQGLLPPGEVVYLMRQIGTALDYAHRQGIVHRDIKPSNIMIDRDGNAFVTDLGIARITEGGKQITETGAMIGTPDYMSPEQITAADDLDARSDIYSLGVMLFQMLTGELPYSSNSQMAVLVMHMQDPIPSAVARRQELPEAVDEVIQIAMAKDRDSRYQTVSEMMNSLTNLLGGTATVTPTALREAAGTSIMKRISGDKHTTGHRTPSEQNRQVTVLYANGAEYAAIVDEVAGSEGSRRAMAALWNAFEKIIAEYSGKVFTRTDNDVMAIWGAESASEQDAEQAIRAGLAMQNTLRLMGAPFLLGDDEELPLNIGVHSGVALVTPSSSSTHSASGATISLTNRLMQTAAGMLLITHDTYRHVRGVFDVEPALPLRVRGRSDPINTYRVLEAKTVTFRTNTRGIEGIETRMIGRDAELKSLQNAFLNALEDGETQVVTVVGDAGIGKSRLLYQFDEWAELRPERYRVFNSRATAATEERPYGLIRNILMTRFNIFDDDSPKMILQKLDEGLRALEMPDLRAVHLMGYLAGFDLSESIHIKPLLADAAGLAAQGRSEFVSFFARLAQQDYVVLQVEDIHHADDASLDLLTALFNAEEESRLLVICNARPLLFQRRPDWGSGQAYHLRIDLKPLDKREARDLVREILQKVAEIPKNLRDLLVERSEGNPYFIEELVKVMIDDRVLVKESDEIWSVQEDRLGALQIPSTLTGLLESRLDTLLYPERLTLQRAAVYGRIFYDRVLQFMDGADDSHVSDLDGVLTRLVEREFIHKRETSAFAGATEYIFAQAILRDTIYERLLERQLETYHRAAADWLRTLDRADEQIVLIAEHYEQAGANAAAAQALYQAANQVFDKGLYAYAAENYQHALNLAPTDDAALRLSVLVKLGSALVANSDLAAVDPILEEAMQLAETRQDQIALAQIMTDMGRAAVQRGDHVQALEYAKHAVQKARQLNNLNILVAALGVQTLAYQNNQMPEEMRQCAEESYQLAQQSGNPVLEMLALNRLGTTMAQTEPEQAIQRLEKALNLAQKIGHRQGQTMITGNLGYIAATSHDWERAAGYAQQALTLARESRDLGTIMVNALNLAEFLTTASKLEQVPALLLEGLEVARRMQAPAVELGVVMSVAIYRIAQGRVREGLEYFGLGKAHPTATPDVLYTITDNLEIWREQIGMNDEEIAAIMKSGETLDLQTVIAAITSEFASA